MRKVPVISQYLLSKSDCFKTDKKTGLRDKFMKIHS